MAITTSMSVDSLGRLLKLWRVGADLKADQVADRASEILKTFKSGGGISRTTVYRYEDDDFPAEGADLDIICAITRACGHVPGELPDEVIDQLEAKRSILRKSCFSEVA